MAQARTYVKGLILHIGPLTINGSLLPIRKTVDKGFNLCTPDGQRVKQVYVDPDGTTWEFDQLDRAQFDENGTVTLRKTAADISAAKAEFPQNILDFNVHGSDCEDMIFPSDNNAYILTPNDKDKVSVTGYDIVQAWLAKTDRILLAYGKVRVSEGVWRLTTWRNSIVLQRQLFPQDVNEVGWVAGGSGEKVDKSVLKRMEKVMETLTTGFDPETYANQQAERIKKTTAEGKVEEEEKPKETKSATSLLDALEASLK